MQIDWSESEQPRRGTPRNVKNIIFYRELSPVHKLFAQLARSLGIGFGSLRNLYALMGSRNVFLLVMDESGRGSVPSSVAQHIADALDIKAITVDFSKHSKDTFLSELYTTERNRKTASGYYELPRYAAGNQILKCKNLRSGNEVNWSLKTLADFIMQEHNRSLNFTAYASWKPEKQEDTSIPEPLTDETYKLLDDPSDFVDFHTKAINSGAVAKVIDFDAIFYDLKTFAPLLIAEIKRGGGFWHITEATGEALGIPAGCVSWFQPEGKPLFFCIDGFGLPKEKEAERKDEFQLIEFMTERLGSERKVRDS